MDALKKAKEFLDELEYDDKMDILFKWSLSGMNDDIFENLLTHIQRTTSDLGF